ncbi:MAG: TonB-dependent receptor [Treponema sp.]|jgi:vitamin B12 transporter|nr:TonB-dependent receptor [Treponema sp.]
MSKPARLFAIFLFYSLLIPLAAQDNSGLGDEYDDDPFDDWLILEGEGLTILGSPNTTQQMETIDRETIEKSHAADLPSLLQEALGLGVTRYGPYGNQAGVNLRGFDIKRVAVLIDGIPVNSTSSGGFDFYSIDPLSIERIEVIHGGSDTKYNVSGALGGVINIITVKKPVTGWSFGGSFSNTSYLPGQYNSQSGGIGNPQWQDIADSQNISLSGSYGTEQSSFGLNVFGNRAGNHFLYQDYFDYTRRKEGNEILDAGASVSYMQNIGDFSKLILSGSFYYGDKNIPVSGYATNYAKQKDSSVRENLMLDMPRFFHDDFSMELILSHNWKRLAYEPGGISSLHDEHNLSLINRWGWYPGTEFTLRFGGDYRFINIDSTNTGLHYAHRGGLYVTPEYSPTKELLLVASIKVMTDGRNIIPVPKIGAAWTVNSSLVLKNNYFRGFKFPDFDDLYWVQEGFMGNPDLRNEDGWGADLSAEFSFDDLLNLDSTIYGQWTENSIHWSNASGTWRPENHGVGAFAGWDNKLKWTLPFSPGFLEKPVLNLSWLLQLSWLLSGDLSFGDNIRIPYMPMHTFGMSLELPWTSANKKLPGSLVVSVRFESSRYSNAANTVELEPCFLLNITYNQRLNENFGLFGKINNVLNTQYVSYADYPMSGVSITLGVNMSSTGVGR